MLQETTGWIILFGVIAASILLFAIPKTRPYILKFWWVFALSALAGASFILLRKRIRLAPPITSEKPREEGAEIKKETTSALDAIVARAEEQLVLQDIELKKRQAETEEARKDFEARVKDAQAIQDSMERRKALIRLVEGEK
jgi:hypothetical protein